MQITIFSQAENCSFYNRNQMELDRKKLVFSGVIISSPFL
jgi:hypothetical protein